MSNLKCGYCGAPVDVVPDGEPRYQPPKADLTSPSAEQLRQAYLAGLREGTGIARNISDWLEGNTSDHAARQINEQEQRLTGLVESGEKPWENESENSQETKSERSSAVAPPTTGR